MIQGVVGGSYEPLTTLTVQGPAGVPREITAVIDTGYNGTLTLPPALVDELGLVRVGINRVFFADERWANIGNYDVTVHWDGEEIEVEASATGGVALVGMLLLDGCELRIDVKIGGRIRIEPSAA